MAACVRQSQVKPKVEVGWVDADLALGQGAEGSRDAGQQARQAVVHAPLDSKRPERGLHVGKGMSVCVTF